MGNVDENYLQKVASKICEVVHWRKPELLIIIMIGISNYDTIYIANAIKAILSCDGQDLVPTST